VPNPFLSGSPVRGEHFGDREDEVRWLVRRMKDGQNVFVMSPRRYGKSSLLIRAAERARNNGVRVGLANLMRCSTRRQVAEEIIHGVVDGALGWRQGTAQQVRERIASLPGVKAQLEHEGWTYSLQVTRSETSFVEEIRRPIKLLAESARGGHPVCLILDEFQQIAEIDETLAGEFKAMTDDLPQVSLVFAGSRRHLMERLFVGAGAPLQNAADPLAVAVIPDQKMVAFLRERSVAGGREMTDEAAQAIYQLVRGIPHFVQLLAAAAWDQEANPIDVPVVKRGLVDVLVTQRGNLADRFEGLTTGQRKFVQTLAGVPTRQVDSKTFLEAADLAKSSAQRARAQLEVLEYIIWDDRMGWRLQDPIFERYLIHGRPLEVGEEINPDAIA
jgi:hypothetical protein